MKTIQIRDTTRHKLGDFMQDPKNDEECDRIIRFLIIFHERHESME